MPSNPCEFLQRSPVYHEFMAERDEILRHKWLESEKLGYDIGFDQAMIDWVKRHREPWRAARRRQNCHAARTQDTAACFQHLPAAYPAAAVS